MRILYPWARPEPLTLLWRNLPIVPPLRKSRVLPPASRPGSFMRLVDLLASTSGRTKFSRLLRDLDAVDLRQQRTPRIVGVMQ